MRYILLLLLAFGCAFDDTNAQDCITPAQSLESAMSHVDVKAALSKRSASSMYTVRIMIHLLKSDEGTWGPLDEAVYEELDTVVQHFAPLGVCFALLGIHDILSTETVNNWDEETTVPELNTMHGSSDRIDIYIVPSFLDFPGNAFAIPNNFLGMGSQRFGLNTLSHELGHTLGLFHTHHNYDLFNTGEITSICDSELERVNGSNCTTAGDLICDTPADPQLTIDDPDDNIDGCLLEGPSFDCNDDLFNPLFENLMAYSLGCRDVFTDGQRDRIHAELGAGTIGPSLVLDENILLTASVIGSGNLLIWSGTYISHPSFVGYSVVNSAKVEHKASDNVVLRPGFHAMPGNGGYYSTQINSLCN